MRRGFVPLLFALVAGGLFYALRDGEERADPALRGPPVLPTPSGAQKVRYFWDLFVSGEQTELGGERIPTWQRIGEQALMALGRPALDFLFSPDRFAAYRRSPDLVANVLRLVPTLPGASRHPALYPFLLHWLDPTHCPAQGEGNDWVTAFRKSIFAIFTHYPDRRAAAACADELDRDQRVEDLRREALLVLLRVGEAAAVRQRYARLPLELQTYLLARLYEFAQARRPESYRAAARTFLPELRSALDSAITLERIYAAGVLLRLGETPMADRLWAEYGRAQALGQEDAAWTAVRILASDRPDARTFELCMQQAAGTQPSFAHEVAGQLLRRNWIDDPSVQALLRQQIETADPRRPLPLPVVLALYRVDAPRVRKLLKAAIAGDNEQWRRDAIRFVRTKRAVPEAGPWIIDRLQRTQDLQERALYYAVLVALRTKAAIPLLRRELADTTDGRMKAIAAGALVEFQDPEGMRMVADLLRKGDPVVLDGLTRRAAAQGASGIPDALVSAILDALQGLPGEESRLKALFILRCRGRLRDVRSRLVAAYRSEPSRRVAAQIETTLRELSYR